MKFTKLNLYRTLLMCAGFMISAFGSALYVYSRLGADAFNLMVQGVSGVLGLAIGLTLGGVVGIGTVLSAVLTDPAIQAASGVLEKRTPQQMQAVSLK